jgi:hypothetical protein
VTSAAVTLFLDFNTLVISHGLDPIMVHRELLKIDEYRRMITVEPITLAGLSVSLKNTPAVDGEPEADRAGGGDSNGDLRRRR